MSKKFDIKKLEKLNNPNRLVTIPPEYIWGTLSLENCQSIVDIGAGTGLFSKAFYTCMKNGMVYAADISEKMIEWMCENIQIKNYSINPVLMEENSIPLEKEIADLVLMINLHHELNNPVSLLKEANRLLKPKGKIAIIDWKKEEMSSGPPLRIRVGSTIIKEQLHSAGFSNVKSDGGLPYHSFVYAEK